MLLSLLLTARPAVAHPSEFGLDAVSGVPGDDQRIWARVRGAGLVHSDNGGQDWVWYCDESAGLPNQIYDIEAVDDGRVLVAGVDGVTLFDTSCGSALLPGMPVGANGDHLARYGDHWLVASTAGDPLGIFSCTLEGCAPTDRVDSTSSIKSIRVDGTTAWATSVDRSTYVPSLWRSEDGATWTLVHSWPANDPAPAVVSARGDRLLAWNTPTLASVTPFYSRSTDGGATWTKVLEFGALGQPTPALVEVGGGFLYTSDPVVFNLYQSLDDGVTWTDLNEQHIEQPTLRCVSDDGRYVCGGHFDTGWDLGRPVGFSFEGISCINGLTASTCPLEAGAADTAGDTATDTSTCELYVDLMLSAAGDDTSRCEQDLSPAGAEGGCGSGSEAAVGLGVLALTVTAHLRRRGARQSGSTNRTRTGT